MNGAPRVVSHPRLMMPPVDSLSVPAGAARLALALAALPVFKFHIDVGPLGLARALVGLEAVLFAAAQAAMRYKAFQQELRCGDCDKKFLGKVRRRGDF